MDENHDKLIKISNSECEGANGIYAQKLPIELFLRTVSFLSPRGLVLATHVCSNWRKQLINHPPLWQNLKVEISNLDCLEEVRAYSARSRGQLHSLTLSCNESGEMDSDVLASLPITALVKSLVNVVSNLDGARNLKHFSIDLSAYQHDTTNVYAILFSLLNWIQYAAVNLKTLFIKSKGFPSSCIFSVALSLEKLTLVTSGAAVNGGGRRDDFPINNLVGESQNTTSTIQEITFNGSLLTDIVFPTTFTNLIRLSLYNMTIPNLYGFLEKSAYNVEHLILAGIKSESPVKFTNTLSDGSLKDSLPILVFPRLISLHLTSFSPNLWRLPSPPNVSGNVNDGHANFMIYTPALKSLKLCELSLFDEETKEHIGEYGCFHSLDPSSVVTLSRQSPVLEELDLSGIGFNSVMTLQSLIELPQSLKRLSLCQIAGDVVLDSLDQSKLPNLEYLDLGECDGNYAEEDGIVTLPAIARFVSRFTKVRGHDVKLEILHEDHDDEDDPDSTVNSLQIDLVNSLFTLSQNQLELLVTSTLKVNPSPNSAPYHIQRQEIISLAQPPKRLDNNKIQEGSRIQAAKKSIASNEAFLECQRKLQRWQMKREAVEAKIYCKSKGVILNPIVEGSEEKEELRIRGDVGEGVSSDEEM